MKVINIYNLPIQVYYSFLRTVNFTVPLIPYNSKWLSVIITITSSFKFLSVLILTVIDLGISLIITYSTK